MLKQFDEYNRRVVDRQNQRSRSRPAMPEEMGRHVGIVVGAILATSLIRIAIRNAWGPGASTAFTLCLLGGYLVVVAAWYLRHRRSERRDPSAPDG